MPYDPDKYESDLGDGTIWYCVDLDNCLAEPVWKTSKGIGEPIHENIKKLIEVYEAGYKIIIHTSRPWMDYEAIERWCQDHGVPARRILCGKPLAYRYVDDKAINSEEKSWIVKE